MARLMTLMVIVTQEVDEEGVFFSGPAGRAVHDSVLSSLCQRGPFLYKTCNFEGPGRLVLGCSFSHGALRCLECRLALGNFALTGN